MKFQEKIETAIREAAVKEFSDDFDAMGEMVTDAFEIVRAKFGYVDEKAAPTNEIYEAMRLPLAAVKLMIATGQKPEGITLPLAGISSLAESYVDRADQDFTNRMLEAVRLIKSEGEGGLEDEEVSA